MPVPFMPGSAQTSMGAGRLVPVGNSSGDVAAASAVATLPAASGLTTYIEGFDVTGAGATGASVVPVTVTGLQTQTGTLTFDVVVPAGATVAIGGTGTPGIVSFRFPTPIPASATNTTIVVTATTFGSGNLHACVTAYGFQA